MRGPPAAGGAAPHVRAARAAMRSREQKLKRLAVMVDGRSSSGGTGQA